MILANLTGGERHPLYARLATQNGIRHYDFLRSIVETAIATQQPFLSQTILKALNHHAIACLHECVGEYRPCRVDVGGRDFPPEHWRVPDLMDQFTNTVNRYWHESNEFGLAAYVLWRLTHIHPFINGNGRTARAACLFVLCVKTGQWLPTQEILPNLIKRTHDDCITLLQRADTAWSEGSETDLDASLTEIAQYLHRLVHGPGGMAPSPHPST